VFRFFVFDLDGTLVDSRRDLADSANLLLEACGAAPLSEEAIGRMVGDGAAVLVGRAFEATGVAPPPDALERFLAIYDRRLLEHTRPYEGVPEMLEALERRASLAVLTNKPLAPTRAILDGLGLARHFATEAVVGGDGPFPRKPDPQGLRHLAEQAGVGLEAALLVGDSLVDWRTARQAPAPICLARYGFGFERFPPGVLAGDERLIDAPREVLNF
jgi:phosphoglycolate phosphatase